ncbi:MAG: PDZ domain-containing protein, partial [Anaerolineales bacterium]|nr:PDZ domain-containing protein [Anaerolineales bacterium]
MRHKSRLLLFWILYSLILVVSAMFAGYQLRSVWPPASEEYGLLREAYRLLENHYLSELPERITLERGMIHGMVDRLGDPYTNYVEPAAHEIQTDDLSGEYGGIGAYLSRGEDKKIHLVPFDDGPAARAGIQEGDILIAVDHQTIDDNTSLETILAMVRGPAGTSVNLILAARKPGDDVIILDIVREAFPIPSVTSYLLPEDPKIGVIVITLFSDKTPQELEESFLNLKSRGMETMVLDLRNNPGGLLDSGVNVARFFLSDGVILIEELPGGAKEVFRAETEGDAVDIPLAVLVNENTASAAEVVAAALQANNRAPLIGTPTFGKGSVQLVFELSDQSSLHVTASRWKTPQGITLDFHG